MTPQEQSTSNPQETPEKAATLYSVVSRTVQTLYRQLSGENTRYAASTRATLSRLRQAVGRTPEQDPLAWSVVLDQVVPDLPEHLLGRGDAASPSETGAFLALTLYALHQRGNSASMHTSRTDLGYAVGRLAQKTDSGSIKPRFDALMAARTPAATAYQLRSLISLLSSAEIPLDYGRLAEDLAALRNPVRRQGVLLRWGRGFARGYQEKKPSDRSAKDQAPA